MRSRILPKVLIFLLFPWFCPAQSAQSPVANPASTDRAPEQNAALKVEPGSPVIKPKDIYEASGYFHPFTRMPAYIIQDQKAEWTSPFHTSKVNAKWWFIVGGAAGALIATDKYTVKHASEYFITGFGRVHGRRVLDPHIPLSPSALPSMWWARTAIRNGCARRGLWDLRR